MKRFVLLLVLVATLLSSAALAAASPPSHAQANRPAHAGNPSDRDKQTDNVVNPLGLIEEWYGW